MDLIGLVIMRQAVDLATHSLGRWLLSLVEQADEELSCWVERLEVARAGDFCASARRLSAAVSLLTRCHSHWLISESLVYQG